MFRRITLRQLLENRIRLSRSVLCLLAILFSGSAIAGGALAESITAGAAIELEDWSYAPTLEEDRGDSTVPGMSVELEGWRYIPVFEEGEVQSFVLLAANPDPRSANIASMWFVRDGRSWFGYSWRNAKQREVLADVKATLGLANETDSYWPVEPEICPEERTEEITREPLGTGVFADGLLSSIVESQSAPKELLSVLVSAGWQAADVTLFESDCRRDQLLDGLADGFALEWAEEGAGVEAIGLAIDDRSCQGGGGGIRCTPRTVIGGVWQSGCIFLGWTLNGTSMKPATGGGCWIENSWTGRHFYYERRRLRKIYANCTSCPMVQQRFNECSARVAEVDMSVGVQDHCVIPAGYTPPAGPSAGTSCSMANQDCDGWTDWSPGVNDGPCP